MTSSSPVFVVDGARTPFLKFRHVPGPFHAADLALQAARPLFQRLPLSPSALDSVILGCVIPSPDESNIARILALRLGCDARTTAWSVQRNCASGMQALDCAHREIREGRADLVLAGGCEAMSHAPWIWRSTLTTWFGEWHRARSIGARLRLLLRLRPGMLAPIVSLSRGLRDPVVGLSMGETAEILAEQFSIHRESMDSFAVRSHHRLAEAMERDWLAREIVPIYSTDGRVFERDDGLRADSTLEKLATLHPVFEAPFGRVTAGNSSQVSDGAAVLLLASEAAIERHGLPVLGRIEDCAWAALEPERMGLGPVYAATRLLRTHALGMDDVDYWEINEAFAAQVLACLSAWESEEWCRAHLGLDAAMGAPQ